MYIDTRPGHKAGAPQTSERLILANRLPQEDLEGRIDCFGEFDRADDVCLSHCSLNFDCAAAREQYQFMQLHEDALETMGFAHSA